MGFDAQIEALNLTLPPASTPAGAYKLAVRSGNQLYVSGHGPTQLNGAWLTGRVVDDLDLKEAYAAARQTGLAMLATLRAELGSLDAIEYLVKATGFVNCPSDFTQQPQVMNGFSVLMGEVFGPEAGFAARSAVGVGSLPGGIPVEVEAIFQLR